MGIYDSFYLEVKCPFCGKIETRECQTKDFGGFFGVYHRGDDIGTDQYNWLECITHCKCKDKDNHFELKVKLDKGIITGEVEFIDEEDNV